MLTTSLRRNQARTVVCGLVALLGCGPLTPASAQLSIIRDPNTLPDLSISVNAPTVVTDIDIQTITISVFNQPPLRTGVFLAGTGNEVRLSVDFNAFLIHSIVTGNMACGIRAAQFPQGNHWNTMDCVGFIPWGKSATVTIKAQYFALPCDGSTAFTDATVRLNSSAEAERTTTNNRVIANSALAEVRAAYCF